MSATVPLRRVARMVYGNALPTEVRAGGDVPVMSSGGVSGSHSVANTLAPTVVIGRKGTFGSVHWSDRPTFVIDTAYFIDQRFTQQDLRWLYYMLLTVDFAATAQDVGVPGLSRDAAYDLPCPVPPTLETQRLIANFLDEQCALIDTLIRLRREQMTLVRSRDYSLLNDRIRGRSTRVHVGGWLGEVEDGWRVSHISALATFCAGAGFPHEHQGNKSGDFPFCKVSDLAASDALRVVTGAANWVDQRTAQMLGAKPADPGVVVFPKVGAALLTNSRAILGVPAVFDNNVMGLRFRTGTPRFWFHVLRGVDMGELSNPGPVPSLNESIVGGIPVPVPDDDTQDRVADELDESMVTTADLSAEMSAAVQLLQARKRSLIAAAVTGEFDVTTASGRGI